MKDLILTGMVTFILIFGYQIMERVDQFLDQNSEQLKEQSPDDDAKSEKE